MILDEVGRGTATFDGLSLAWAIVEYLHEHRRPKTLFATHYHELTELASLLPRVVNRTMAVKEWEERIVFLRRVVPGSADKSYGLHVARLAGLPPEVIDRAGEILANLESQEYDPTGKPRLARGTTPRSTGQPAQLTLFAPPEQVVAAAAAGRGRGPADAAGGAESAAQPEVAAGVRSPAMNPPIRSSSASRGRSWTRRPRRSSPPTSPAG